MRDEAADDKATGRREQLEAEALRALEDQIEKRAKE